MSQSSRSSLSEAALHGTAWTTLQTALNKVAALVATLVLARCLTPDDFGAAYRASTIAAFACVLAPWVLNDLLVSMPNRFSKVAGTAFLLGIGVALFFSIGLCVAAPAIAQREHEVRWLAWLLVAAACRPMADALMAIPWARLRIDLAYRDLAVTDGTCQLFGTMLSVVLALTGFGPFAVVAPPVLVLFLQAAWYWKRTSSRLDLRWDSSLLMPLARTFTTAALSQYLNNVVKILELLLLGWLATTAQVGIFAFAFQLSTQANVIISNQISSVMQPILSHINDAPDRQTSAFLRALRLVGCVGIPISLVQGAVAVPAFHLFFGSRWDDAIPAFAALSVMQAFIFLATPVLILLKAQGHFRAILTWQLSHIVAGALLMWVAVGASQSGGPLSEALAKIGVSDVAATPMMVAMAGTLLWGLGCPAALRFGTRGSRADFGQLLRVLGQGWPASLVAAAIVAALPPTLPFTTTTESIFALVLAVPCTIAAILLSCRVHPQSREDLARLLHRISRRIHRRA